MHRVDEDETVGRLDCNNYHTFWIQWKIFVPTNQDYKYMHVGSGDEVGIYRFLQRQYKNIYYPTHVYVRTGQGVKGNWTFKEIPASRESPEITKSTIRTKA